ncbi:hypothetical protein A0256_19955 [Mucilaginibacter sp. PAMC 26640]|nr:hypothetical protein A0256_19955 [Mucilaginibacter sp. PAMC 26640]
MKIKLTGILAIVAFFHFQSVLARPKIIIRAKNKIALISKPSVADLTRNVEFGFCKANVPSLDSVQLNGLAQYLLENKYAVALRGHADAVGSYVGNWKMSEARANAIKAYLVSRGIAEDRIVTTAFGSTVPIANNRTSNGRQKNRRVEIRLKPIGDQN